MGRLSGFLAFSLAPFLGLVLALSLSLRAEALSLNLAGLSPGIKSLEGEFEELQEEVGFLASLVEEQNRHYEEQKQILEELAARSQERRQLSDEVYEARILAKLGPPIASHTSERVEVMVFELKEMGYRGYIAKLKLFDPSAFQVVLGKDTLGHMETTSSAVARTGALLGINGGGHYQTSRGGRQQMVPLGNTVIDGNLVQGFSPAGSGLFFAGVDAGGDLIGGSFSSKEELMALEPWQGVSFLPPLLRDGAPLPLPEDWQRQRHPRTVIGEYGNGDLVLIVVDGRQEGWSYGVTLEELQIKLLDLGVLEAYNLDGGGSSSFVYDGQVLNRPSDGRERPVATNFVLFP